MLDEIKKLKHKYQTATNEVEVGAIKTEMKSLFNENPDVFTDSIVACIKESNQKADELLLRQKLEDVLPILSVSYLSKNYFKKTPQWFYQRLNGNSVNGKEAQFTPNELETLSNALKEIGEKLNKTAAFVI
jgi:predicted ribosome quality control (RQC) complex YloA/Tae2 family protein